MVLTLPTTSRRCRAAWTVLREGRKTLPYAQNSEEARVIAAGILLNDVQDVAIVLHLAFSIRCGAECSPDGDLLKTHHRLLGPPQRCTPRAAPILRRHVPIDASPSVDASRNHYHPIARHYGKEHRRFAPFGDRTSCTDGTQEHGELFERHDDETSARRG